MTASAWDIVHYCEHPNRSEPHVTTIRPDVLTAFDEDVNQEWHLRVIEHMIDRQVTFDSSGYFEAIEEHVGTDLSRLLMQDAKREIHKLNDQTARRRELMDSLVSWDLEQLEKAMSAPTDMGLPATEHAFQSYSDLEQSLESDIAQQYELSEAATEIFHLFHNGTTAQRRAILLMVQAARHTEQGIPLPNSLMCKLKYVRKQVKELGWDLDVALLR